MAAHEYDSENISLPQGQGIHVSESIVIHVPVEDLYGFWRHFEQLPMFMDHLQSVEVLPDGRSHWVAKAPFGTRVEWVASVINDVPNEVIAWRSDENSPVAQAGSVRFFPSPDGESTQIQVDMEYIPPAGAVGTAVTALFGQDPGQQIRHELERLKEILEGELKDDTQPSRPISI